MLADAGFVNLFGVLQCLDKHAILPVFNFKKKYFQINIFRRELRWV